jgi:hypothetical protein
MDEKEPELNNSASTAQTALCLLPIMVMDSGFIDTLFAPHIAKPTLVAAYPCRFYSNITRTYEKCVFHLN